MKERVERLQLPVQVKALLRDLLRKIDELTTKKPNLKSFDNEISSLADALRDVSPIKIEEIRQIIMETSNNKQLPMGFGLAVADIIKDTAFKPRQNPYMKVNPIPKIATESPQLKAIPLSESQPEQYALLLKKFNVEFNKREVNVWATIVNRDPNLLQVDKEKLLKKIEESENLKLSFMLQLHDIREKNDPEHLQYQMAYWQGLVKSNAELTLNDQNELLAELAVPVVAVVSESAVIKTSLIEHFEKIRLGTSRHTLDVWLEHVLENPKLSDADREELTKLGTESPQVNVSAASAVNNRINAGLVHAAQPGRLAPPVVASADARALWTQIYKGDFTYPSNDDLRGMLQRALPLFKRVEPFKSDAALQSALSEAIQPTIYRNNGQLEDRIDLTLRKYFSRLQVSSVPEPYSQIYEDFTAGSFAMSGANLTFDVQALEDNNVEGYPDKYKALVNESRREDAANPIAMVQGIRGDGNCYYRSVLRSHLENLIGMSDPNQKQEYFKHLSEAIKHHLGKPNSLFRQRATRIEKHNVNELLAKLDQAARGQIWSGRHALVEFDRDMAMSDPSSIDSSLITAARYMTAQYVADYPDVIYNGISLKNAVELSGNGSYDQYVNLIIKDGECAQGAFVDLGMLPALIGAKSNIHIMDRRDEYRYQKLTITEGLCGEYTGPKIQPLEQAAELLFRPGHYDMLRTKSSFVARQAQYNSYAASIQVGSYLAPGMPANPPLNRATLAAVRESANQDPKPPSIR